MRNENPVSKNDIIRKIYENINLYYSSLFILAIPIINVFIEFNTMLAIINFYCLESFNYWTY